MGAFKEEVIYLEELAKKQNQIFWDSADIGISVEDLDINRMRTTIKTLLDLPGSKIIFKMDNPVVQRQYKLVVMWDKYDSTIIDLLYYHGKKEEFFSINIS